MARHVGERVNRHVEKCSGASLALAWTADPHPCIRCTRLFLRRRCTQIQSTAIVRYFARMYGMYGDSDDEANAIDEISAGLRDYLSLLTDIPFSKNRAADLDVVRVRRRGCATPTRRGAGC